MITCPAGTTSTQVVPGLSFIGAPLVDTNCNGDDKDGRFHVPLTKTPFLKISSGPVPVGSTITSKPPSEFSTHGPSV